MGTGTNLEQDILTARIRANAERRVGNHVEALAWDAEAEALTDRLITLSRRADWNLLADNRHG